MDDLKGQLIRDAWARIACSALALENGVSQSTLSINETIALSDTIAANARMIKDMGGV